MEAQSSLGLDVEERQITREVTLKLTNTDLAELAVQMGELKTRKEEKELELKEVTKPLKDDIAQAEAKIDSLLDLVNRGEQAKLVPVTERKDFGSNTVVYLHEGAVVEERAMTAEERQPSLIQDPASDDGFQDAAPVTDEEVRQDIADVIQQERNPNKPDVTAGA